MALPARPARPLLPFAALADLLYRLLESKLTRTLNMYEAPLLPPQQHFKVSNPNFNGQLLSEQRGIIATPSIAQPAA